jgi:hypothetical protein
MTRVPATATPDLCTCRPPDALRLQRPGLHSRALPAYPSRLSLRPPARLCPPCLGLHLPTVPQPPFARCGLRHPGRCASASALAVRPQTSTLLPAPVLWTLLRPPLTRPLASSTPSVPRLWRPSPHPAVVPRQPPPRPPCSNWCQSSGLHFGHRSPILRHPRHQVCPDSDAPASDLPPPHCDSNSLASTHPPPCPNAVSSSSSMPERWPAGELYFSLLIATCLL